MIANFIIWNVKPTIFQIGSLPIRWYGLLFVAGFIIGPKLGRYIYKTENKPVEDVERLVLYLMVGTIIGARFGHVLFYDLSYFLKHPLEAFLPISFTPSFHISGYRGLASHGATVGNIIAIYLYCKYNIEIGIFPPKFKVTEQIRKGQSFLWVCNIVVIGVAIGGGLIRIANFMNHEIYGKATNSKFGVLFTNEVNELIQSRSAAIMNVKINKTPNNSVNLNKNLIDINITFKKNYQNEELIKRFLENNIKQALVFNSNQKKYNHIIEKDSTPLNYDLKKDKIGRYIGTIHTQGIPRHPAQLYEAISCFVIFIILFSIWKLYWRTLREGLLIGIFLIHIFSFRFIFEFYKESKIMPGFDTLTRPHILSIVAIILGILFIVFSKKSKHSIKKESNEK